MPDETSTSSTDEEISAFWRKGQPPRGILVIFHSYFGFFRQINCKLKITGDVVVKLVNQEPKMNAEFKSEPSMPKMNAAERVANKILVGPIHKVQKIGKWLCINFTEKIVKFLEKMIIHVSRKNYHIISRKFFLYFWLEAPKLPPLKFAYQHVEHHNLEDQPNCLNQRRASTLMETINETIGT